MFDRATITLGIGPHSSILLVAATDGRDIEVIYPENTSCP